MIFVLFYNLCHVINHLFLELFSSICNRLNDWHLEWVPLLLVFPYSVQINRWFLLLPSKPARNINTRSSCLCDAMVNILCNRSLAPQPPGMKGHMLKVVTWCEVDVDMLKFDFIDAVSRPHSAAASSSETCVSPSLKTSQQWCFVPSRNKPTFPDQELGFCVSQLLSLHQSKQCITVWCFRKSF